MKAKLSRAGLPMGSPITGVSLGSSPNLFAIYVVMVFLTNDFVRS